MARAEPLELVRNFLNTLDLEVFGEHSAVPDEERDAIDSPSKLKAWLVRQDLCRAKDRITRADVEQARVLRDGLRDMLRAAQGLSFDKGRLKEAGSVSDGLVLYLDLSAAGLPRLEAQDSGARGALARIMREVATGAVDESLRRLKVCSADDCQYVFYDHSKSRTQRWCSMETCGNREKTRRYRHRHTA
jgi:predicted RNA-binding Zn ribbon-like protein